ncbi:MAG: ABC transporter [Betaproteobacteria bacterium RIFCSPLOWO2_02_FULL_63_19]|nr:MAG: ABC transporter [Betaproteobacteria bacterium RIFCSPLOWO2_02_FULL_63_19]
MWRSTDIVRLMSATPYLSIRSVRKAYSSHGRTTVALGGVDLDVERGSFVSIVGPSGCGKSTLLQIVAGLMPATGGEVRIEDRVVREPPPAAIYVFQQYTRSLYPWKTVERNVAYGLENREALTREGVRARTHEYIGLVKLDGFERHYPWQLSGGMQQRVAIARALACRPDVLLMDEPFSSVDALTRVGLQELVLRLWRELGLTVILVTHDTEEAIYLSTRVVVLSASPAVVSIDLPIDLPHPRDQITTREQPRYLEYRHRVLGKLFTAEGLATGDAAASAPAAQGAA